MAYMLYAEIAMYQNDEERMRKSFTYMKEIIDSGKYALNPDYTNIFKESGEWTDESIFEVNYKDDNAIRDWDSPLCGRRHRASHSLSAPITGPAEPTDMMVAGDSALVRQETFDRYEDGDTRRDATCWNAGTVGASYNALSRHRPFP